MSSSIAEWEIDVIKEDISHYCEATIDHSQLSYQEIGRIDAPNETKPGRVYPRREG